MNTLRDNGSTRIIRKLLMTIMPVQALAMGLPSINGLINTFIIGNFIGSDALATIGFCDPLTLLISVANCILASGSQILCGQYLGKGDREGIRRAFSTTVTFCVLIGLVFSLLCGFAPVTVARLLGASGDCLAPTAEYIRGYCFGIPFMILSASLLPFLQLDQAAGMSTVSVSVMVLVNVGFNLLNAFVLKLGMFGVGLATSLANIAIVLVMLPYFLFKTKTFKFSASHIDMAELRKLSYQGLPAGNNPICFAIRNRVINQYVFSLGGATAMAAVTVGCSIANAVGLVIEGGYLGAGRLLSSVLVGERDGTSLRKLGDIMVRSAGWIFALGYALVFFLARPISLLMGATAENIATYVLIVRLVNGWTLTTIYKSPLLCVYQAMGEIITVSVLQILGCVVYPVLALVLFANKLGLAFAVGQFFLGDLLMLVTCAALYAYRAKRMPSSLRDITYVPDSLDAPAEDLFLMTIRSLEDTTTVSEALVSFAKAKGLPNKTAYYSGLCVEELTNNTVTHGFPKNGATENTIDVRAIYENGGMTIMLRDDCVPFDPNEWLSVYKSDDPMASIGIKMVAKLSRSMTYAGTLGLNVVNIEL